MSTTYHYRKQDKKVSGQEEEAFALDIVLQRAFDHALQANIISIVGNDRIIRANRSACKLLGYSKMELLTKCKKDILDMSGIDYKRTFRGLKVNGAHKFDLSVIQKNGRSIPCEVTSVIIKDRNDFRHAITTIVALKSISGSTSLQLKNDDWINSMVKISYDLICDWDLATNLISFGSNYEDIFGYKLPKNKISFDEWIELFLPEERTVIENKVNAILESESMNWEYTFKLSCPDGTVSQVISRANIIRDPAGKAVRMIGIIHDVSKQQKLEVKLERELMVKEREIIEAIVEAKEVERSDLGKELHDNVNQLLGASMLYLDMARKDIKNGESYLVHSSEYTLAAIEEIRKLTKGLMSDTIQEFGLNEAIGHIIKDTMEVNSLKINYKLDPSLEDLMSDKFKLNIFRIIQEQLNNILKHAKASDANIAFSKTNSGLILYIADNGVGFNTKKKANGIGISNIISRTKLYNGNADFNSKPGKGCKFVFTFPLLSVY